MFPRGGRRKRREEECLSFESRSLVKSPNDYPLLFLVRTVPDMRRDWPLVLMSIRFPLWVIHLFSTVGLMLSKCRVLISHAISHLWPSQENVRMKRPLLHRRWPAYFVAGDDTVITYHFLVLRSYTRIVNVITVSPLPFFFFFCSIPFIFHVFIPYLSLPNSSSDSNLSSL